MKKTEKAQAKEEKVSSTWQYKHNMCYLLQRFAIDER